MTAMGRVTGAVLSVLLIGGGAMGTLGGMLGTWAETTSVALMGVGLWVCSGVLASRVGPRTTPGVRVPRQVS